MSVPKRIPFDVLLIPLKSTERLNLIFVSDVLAVPNNSRSPGRDGLTHLFQSMVPERHMSNAISPKKKSKRGGIWMEGVCVCIYIYIYLEPQTTIKKWMFGETTISHVKIGNHPIDSQPFINGCLGFQVYIYNCP